VIMANIAPPPTHTTAANTWSTFRAPYQDIVPPGAGTVLVIHHV
jgi:hypothetical protein